MPVHRSTVDLLTEGQGRHLVASLAQVEAVLDEIEATIRQSGSPHGVLARVVDDLPAGFARAIEPPLARARTPLADLVAVLDLQAPATSAYRTVQALIMPTLVMLDDTGTLNPRGYGDIHPVLPDLLDPALSCIPEEVRTIGEVLAAAPGKKQPAESIR
jgi:hypothetical protein